MMNNDLISRAALLENYGLKNAVKYGNETAEQQHNSYSTLMLYEIADMIEDAPAVEAVSKEAYDNLYVKYCELARLTNEVMPQLMKVMREFNDNAPRKAGKWINVHEMCGEIYGTCSECGTERARLTSMGKIFEQFCLDCGAKMDGDSNG